VVAEFVESGYAALWFGETLGGEAFTNASVFLSATSRLVVATGIANIFVRDAWAANTPRPRRSRGRTRTGPSCGWLRSGGTSTNRREAAGHGGYGVAP
jgi:hypothetical protein